MSDFCELVVDNYDVKIFEYFNVNSSNRCISFFAFFLSFLHYFLKVFIFSKYNTAVAAKS